MHWGFGYLLTSGIIVVTQSASIGLAGPLPSKDDSQSVSAKIIEIVEPNSSEVSVNDRSARIGDRAYNGSIVKTGLARAALEFSGDAVLRMGRASEIRIGGPCFYLALGIALSSGKGDICLESLDIDSPQTNYIVKVEPGKGTVITVLEGTVRARVRSPNSKDDAGSIARRVVIDAGYERAFTPQGVATTARRLSLNDYRVILNGQLFLGFQRKLPDQRQLDEVLIRLSALDSGGLIIQADPGDQYGL